MKKILTLFLINILLLNVLQAQDYISQGDAAVKNGNYQSAIDYYQLAYEANPSDDITKKLNFAQNLKKEFDAIDAALKSKNTDEAQLHINNVLLIDPTNKFVEAKQNEISSIIEKNKQAKKDYNSRKIKYALLGDDDKHDIFGGFHYRTGYELNYSSFVTDLYYNNSAMIPITFELIINWDELLYTGILYNFSIFEKMTLDFGGGYDFNNEDWCFKTGTTIMFDNEGWGGINYSLTFNNYETYHTISYVWGKNPTSAITGLGIIIGLLYLAGSL